MGPEPTWICLTDVVHFVNIYQYNKVCMVILAKVELIQGLLAIDLHVTFEPIKYPHTFHDLLQDGNSLCM